MHMIVSLEDCFNLGHVAKTKGFKGEISVFLDVDDPYRYKNLERFLIDLNGNLSPFFIKKLKIRSNGFADVILDGIETKDMAKTISGKSIYLPLTDLPDLPDDEYYLHDLKGMKVESQEGSLIGIVEQVLDYSNNPLLEVRQGQDEILIPINDQFVISVNKKDGLIKVDLPDGLVEVNKS